MHSSNVKGGAGNQSVQRFLERNATQATGIRQDCDEEYLGTTLESQGPRKWSTFLGTQYLNKPLRKKDVWPGKNPRQKKWIIGRAVDEKRVNERGADRRKIAMVPKTARILRSRTQEKSITDCGVLKKKKGCYGSLLGGVGKSRGQ